MATRQKTKRTVRRGTAKVVTRKSAAKRAASKRTARRAAPRTQTNGKANGKPRVSRSQPESLRLRSMMPSYTVNDLEKTMAWYTEGLGFVVSERWEHEGKLLGVMLKAGSCTFGLSQDDFAKGRDREKGLGFRIYADTTQSVDALAERIRAFGGNIIAEPADTPWGSRSFTVEDPDGFKISFNQPL